MNEPTEELIELRAQRDEALAQLDVALAEQDETTYRMSNLDSPAAASNRGRAGGIAYAREIVRRAFGLE